MEERGICPFCFSCLTDCLGIGCLIVTNEEEEVVGMFNERDLIRRVFSHPHGLKVSVVSLDSSEVTLTPFLANCDVHRPSGCHLSGNSRAMPSFNAIRKL